MKHVNDLGEEFFVDFCIYDVNTTDAKAFDKIINPFDLNITKNYPYKDDEKNKECFLEIEYMDEDILVIFKTEEIPSFVELYEPYIIFRDDGKVDYDVEYRFSVVNDKNELVLMSGTSFIILDINSFDVIRYGMLENVGQYGINLFYKDGVYVVEDCNHLFSVYDEELKFIKYVNSVDEVNL